jgi:hypothetical protein
LGEVLAPTLAMVEVAPALSHDPICQMVKDLPDSCGRNAMHFLMAGRPLAMLVGFGLFIFLSKILFLICSLSFRLQLIIVRKELIPIKIYLKLI